MSRTSIEYRPIGTIYTGHTRPDDTPIQPAYASGCRGKVEVLPEFTEGLCDLEGFSHVYLVYHFHAADKATMRVKPFLETTERGIFATRAPCRPNPIGFSIVRLLGRQDNVLEVDGADMLNGTPLLDIKPYVKRFDCILDTKNGWQDQVDKSTAHALGTRRCKSRPMTE